ncbi:PAS domain S-box protein [Thermoleptolyngbya sichuanensis XZ-Cy5]|nr:PAS domain S-box protein [Thermoleptolyngbya sichuanensis]MDG2616246.1 PAS domain S-box protein [Thermoleptolyngbya sichuanensis XZ-Cy5]
MPKSLPLRNLLILASVAQIIGVVGLVGYLSFRNGQKAVNDLANQLRQELTARIERELQGYFAVPHEINRLNASAFSLGDLDVENASRGESQFYQQMKIAPTVAFVYCGSAQTGEFFGVLRSPQDGSLQLSYGNASNNFLREYYSLDVRGERTYRLRQLDRPFDSRQRPWYKAAVLAERPTWTDIYIAFTTGLPNVTASQPVYDKAGRKLIGVCATDVVLPEEFRMFLRNLQIGKTGQAFIMDRSGNLISNSIDEPLMQGEGQDAKLLPATASKDRLVRETATYLTRRFGGFDASAIAQPQRLDFSLDGQRQFLEVVPFRDGYGLDWLIVVVVPESDFMAQIDANTRNTALLCLGALGASILGSILTARWITGPILRVTQATAGIAEGNWGQPVEPIGSITEIQTLANTFTRMSHQLKDSFEALRQSEATNRAIVTAIPDLLMRVSGDGTYIDIVGGDRLLQVYGNEQFVPGSNVTDSLPRAIAETRLKYIQQALTTGRLQVYEQQIEVNGKRQDEEVRIAVLGQDEVLIMVRDITARKRVEESLRIAEEKYRSIYENAVEGIFQSTTDGRYINVNPAMARLYGYDSSEDMVNSVKDISTQIYVQPERRQAFKTALEITDQIEAFTYQSYQKDGTMIWVEESTRAVRDPQGNILYYEGIVQDITERKRWEEEIRRHLEELQIEIDQSRRATEVEMITRSNYFQEIQEEISGFDLDQFWS